MTEIYRYALDPSGTNHNNLVMDEVHTLSANTIRACAVQYGAFFGESVRVYDNITNRLLVEGIDYELVELLQEPSLLYAKSIYAMLVVKNPVVSNTIRLNYQVLGGYYQYNHVNLVALLEQLLNDDRPVDWVNGVVNKPIAYPPTAHPHIGEDLTGLGPVVVALERLGNAISVGNTTEFNRLVEWVVRYVQNPDTATLEETLLGTGGNKPVNAENATILINRIKANVKHVLYFAEANYTPNSLAVTAVANTQGLPDGTKLRFSFFNEETPLSMAGTTVKNNTASANINVAKTTQRLTCVLEEEIKNTWVKVRTIRQNLAPIIDIDNMAVLTSVNCKSCAVSATQMYFQDR